jgi:hypothetical protein
MQLTSKNHNVLTPIPLPTSIQEKWEKKLPDIRVGMPTSLDILLNMIPTNKISSKIAPKIFEDENKRYWFEPKINIVTRRDGEKDLSFNYVFGIQAIWILPEERSAIEALVIQVTSNYLELSYYIEYIHNTMYFLVSSSVLDNPLSTIEEVIENSNQLQKIFNCIAASCDEKYKRQNFSVIDIAPVLSICTEHIGFKAISQSILQLNKNDYKLVLKYPLNLKYFLGNRLKKQDLSLGLKIRRIVLEDPIFKKLFEFKDEVIFCHKCEYLEHNLQMILSDSSDKLPLRTIDLYSIARFLSIYHLIVVDIDILNTILHDIAVSVAPIAPLPIQPYKELSYLLELYLGASAGVGGQGSSPIFVYPQFKIWLHEKMRFPSANNDNLLSPVISNFQVTLLQGKVTIGEKARNGGRSILLNGEKATSNPLFT